MTYFEIVKKEISSLVARKLQKELTVISLCTIDTISLRARKWGDYTEGKKPGISDDVVRLNTLDIRFASVQISGNYISIKCLIHD